jgi:hypothetical protein
MMEMFGEYGFRVSFLKSQVVYDDMFLLLRIWKANASAKLGPVDTRERASIEYRKKLREKWGGEKGVSSIEKWVLSLLPLFGEILL